MAERRPVGALVVDFDGTACTADVVEVLLERFGDPRWTTLNDRMVDGSIGLREGTGRQAELLTGTREAMLAYAVDRCPLDPTFPRFVAWAEERGIELTIVSDGFGFYIRPILAAAGLEHLRVVTNDLVFDPDPRLEHPNGHPECIGCGTCKMLATRAARDACGSVGFVGEGPSDRYGAFYADIVFAKDFLAEVCERDGVPFVPWNDFDDISRVLDAATTLPGPVSPVQCPGWMLPLPFPPH